MQPNKGWTSNRLHVALTAFALAMTGAWLVSPYMSAKGCPEIVEDYFKYLVFYILVVTSVRDEGSLRKLLLLYLLAVALYTGHSFLEFLNGRCQWRMGVRRMIGVNETIGDANGFAANLVLALPLTIPFWVTPSSRGLRAALIAFTLMACGCVLLTGSRAGLLALGVCALLCLAAVGRVKTAAALLVLAAIAAPIVWSCLPEDLQMRYETIIDPSVGPKNAEQSALGRLDGLILGFEAWQQSPLLGYGPGGFKYVTGREGGAHNLYGQTLAETGALGAAGLAGIVFCFWRNGREARRFHRKNPEQRRTFASHAIRAMGLCVILLLFLGMAGHNLFRFYWIWFAAFQAVALHCVRRRAVAVEAPACEPSLAVPQTA